MVKLYKKIKTKVAQVGKVLVKKRKLARKGNQLVDMDNKKIARAILNKAKELGASLAGFAAIDNLKATKSYEIYDKKPFYEDYKGVKWKKEYKTILVWALEHPISEPALDWWSMKVPGFTPGNRIMMMQSKKLRIWMGEELGIRAQSLPYHIERGGVFLKDSAVLAGLGIIGKNNLLVTPEIGPRLRLRGIFIEAELEQTGPIDYNPCKGCDIPCHKACPRDAFRSGVFEREPCKIENDKREAEWEILEGSIMGIDESSEVNKPCRLCEIACPIAQ